jgi:hypothetical protein
LRIEITSSRKFVIQGFIYITKFESEVPTLLQAKMAQQSKQMRVGAHEGFAYNSVKLVSLANGKMYEVELNTFFSSDLALYPLKILHSPNSSFH